MPKNKFQEVIFTIIMVFFMVYAMICYNIALNKDGMTNEVFLLAFKCRKVHFSHRIGTKSLLRKKLMFFIIIFAVLLLK